MSARACVAAAAVLLGALLGCDALLDTNPPSPVYLRVQNASTVTFDEVTLATVDGLKTWTDVGPGDTTSYVKVSAAYGVVSTEVLTGTDTLRIQVIDFTGEQYLETGFYTLLLNVSNPQGDAPTLVQVMRRDD